MRKWRKIWKERIAAVAAATNEFIGGALVTLAEEEEGGGRNGRLLPVTADAVSTHGHRVSGQH